MKQPGIIARSKACCIRKHNLAARAEEPLNSEKTSDPAPEPQIPQALNESDLRCV